MCVGGRGVVCRCVCVCVRRMEVGSQKLFFLFLAVDQKLHCSKNMATFMGIPILQFLIT